MKEVSAYLDSHLRGYLDNAGTHEPCARSKGLISDNQETLNNSGRSISLPAPKTVKFSICVAIVPAILVPSE